MADANPDFGAIEKLQQRTPGTWVKANTDADLGALQNLVSEDKHPGGSWCISEEAVARVWTEAPDWSGQSNCCTGQCVHTIPIKTQLKNYPENVTCSSRLRLYILAIYFIYLFCFLLFLFFIINFLSCEW